MKNLSLAVRISLGLTSLALSVLCALHYLGVMPDSTTALVNGRKRLCEAVAIYSSSAAARGELELIESSTKKVLERDPDIESAAIRLEDGRTILQLGPPAPPMTETEARLSTKCALIPIFIESRQWGAVEIRFRSDNASKIEIFRTNPTLRFITLTTAGLFLSNCFYLFIVFGRSRGGASGIPERVRATLDTLVEGVLLMDRDQTIALANSAFARSVGRSVEEIEGCTVEDMAWTSTPGSDEAGELPWDHAVTNGQAELGAIVSLRTHGNGLRTYSVNSTPILADDGSRQGTLATFDDMTDIERKNLQLQKLLAKLKRSRAEIRDQNRKLTDLATRDPLTSCLNRRAFYERFDIEWKMARRRGQELSCMMLDIDHFKSVNDRFGHAVGDQAIQVVAGVLRSSVRPSDLVCRYGGEEFCVLMPQTGIAEAIMAAERFREKIAASPFANTSVTASFGVTILTSATKDPHDLIDQADQALYAAKRAGRNRVIPFDSIPAVTPSSEPKKLETSRDDRDIPIPYHAVTSLISALAHRDPSTAEHSRRVADLCVQTSKGLLSERDSYVLEIAGLLHDIGKLGIPDTILKKPGPLTEAEWRVMRAHDSMGVEIVTTAFASDELREIIRTHHARYTGDPRNPELPSGIDIPLGARILSIADSYDAMISDRVYRKGRGREEAFFELRRCAGTQFDPELVERFIKSHLARDASRQESLSPLSKRDALRIGLIIEKLAEAFDAKDMSNLKLIAARLGATAIECEVEAIAKVTKKLEDAIAERADWVDITLLTSDILELCRSTQASYLSAYPCEEFNTGPSGPSPSDSFQGGPTRQSTGSAGVVPRHRLESEKATVRNGPSFSVNQASEQGPPETRESKGRRSVSATVSHITPVAHKH